jgi:hypothetical protein
MMYCNYTRELISRFQLNRYVTKEQYLNDPERVKNKLPDSKGVYFVVHPCNRKDDIFMYPGTGRHFKGKDPNVPIEVLRAKWVEGADILYIGKAGGTYKNGKTSSATLKKRIIELLKFGCGKNIGHRGGRYICQHKENKDFRIYWYECDQENPAELERQLIGDFIAEYGVKPFANLR